jgi:hypothetical protein
MRGDEQMEELIDAALRSYAEPGEIPEARVAAARVMERARAAESRRRFWWWVVVVPAAACLLVAMVGEIWMTRAARVPEIAWAPKAPGVVKGDKGIPQRLKPDSSRSIDGTAEAVPLQNGLAAPKAVQVATAGVLEKRQLPKMEVFPTPRPLTAEEQALTVFTEKTTPEVKKQVVEAEKHLGDPIAIAELKIRPLDEEDREKGTGNRE